MRFVVRSVLQLHHAMEQVAAKLDGKPYTLTIKPFYVPRSLEQNKKMHAMFGELADHCGYSRNQMKDICKREFGPTVTVTIGQRIIDAPKGTSEYDVAECSEMIEHLYQLGAEVGCVFQDV